MKHKPSILIIGAGMAGLSAGCYAQMNGFESRIFEMGQRAGGVCQSWERNGYTVNGCIHWLVGSNPKSSFYGIWEELGAVQNLRFIDHDRFGTFEHSEGTIILFSDADRLQEHLLEVAPEDARWIRSLTHGIRVLSGFELSPMDEKRGLAAWLENASFLITRFPVVREMFRWLGLTIGDFAAKLKNPILKSVFLHFWHPDMSMIAFVATLAFLHRKIAGYPVGGSALFIEQVVDRYESLGGTIHYGAEVEEIIVRDGKAVGVRLCDGAIHYADFIVAAADGHATIFKMLKGKFVNARLQKHYDVLQPFPPLLFASFGIRESFSQIPSSVMGIEFPLSKPLSIGNQQVDRMGVQIYNFDPTLAAKGKTVITSMLEADFDYWNELYQEREHYLAVKENVLRLWLQGLEERFPGITQKVEMSDLSTPATFHHYTGNFRGSYEGWLPTPLALRTKMDKTLPGLENFFLAGHWVEPGGGLPPAAMSGRNVVKAICRQRGIDFKTVKKLAYHEHQ